MTGWSLNANPVDFSGNELAHFVLEPRTDELAQHNLRDIASIKSIFGGENQVIIGSPQVYALHKMQLPEVEGNASIQNLLKNHDLYAIQLSCSFRPAPKCSFAKASIEISVRNEEDLGETPIIIDLLPQEIFLPITYERKFSITPQLELEFEKVAQVKASAFALENTQSYVVYQPEIVAFGKGTDRIGWDFNKSSSRKLLGIKDLFFLVKCSKFTRISGALTLSNCNVQTEIGGIALPSTFLKRGSSSEPTMKMIINIT